MTAAANTAAVIFYRIYAFNYKVNKNTGIRSSCDLSRLFFSGKRFALVEKL